MNDVTEKSKFEQFLHQLIDVKPTDITLKFIFDNVRNYGIAATVMVAGVYLRRHAGQVSLSSFSDMVFGSLFVLSGFILYVLNFLQASWAITKFKVRVIPFFILSLTIFFYISEFLWVFIKQYMQKI